MEQIKQEYDKDDSWDRIYPDVVKLLDHNEMGILRHSVNAFTLAKLDDEWQHVPINDMIAYITFKAVLVDRNLLWKVLWCKSNLQLRYIPKHDALRWNGGVFEKCGWSWEVRDEHKTQQQESLTRPE